MHKLSAIVITKNVAEHIRQCLQSINWVDEIVVVDSGSTDDTLTICQQFTSQIYKMDWPGFGPQKNRALARAKHEWVLSIDADEWLDEKLISEIKNIIASETKYAAFAIKRYSNYCGKLIKFGDWQNDWPVRLFQRTLAQFSNDLVHERLVVDGNIGRLKGMMYHNSFSNLSEVLQKVDLYSTLSAEQLLAKNKKSSLTKAIIHSLWTFIHGYIFKAGFLDGKQGFMLAVSNAEGTYYRYLKLMLLHSNKL